MDEATNAPASSPRPVAAITVDLLGVRGSSPSSGQHTARYGGATSCVALSASAGADPDLILDAGTGLRELGKLLGSPFDGAVLLSHLHWDHVQGLPFAGALLDPEARVAVAVPNDAATTPLGALLPGFSPPVFPVRPDELGRDWRFLPIEQEWRFAGWTIRSADVRHKGGRTAGLRVERNERAVVYLPDHDLEDADPAAEELARGADLLIHDAQYLASEISAFRAFGHSTVERACDFADAAKVKHLLLFHHAPERTDDELDELADRWRFTPGGIPVTVARQGDRLTV